MVSQFKFKQILFAFTLLLTIRNGSGLLEWLFGEQKAKLRESNDSEEPITRFEVLSTDEKFLDFATALADLSPLDACYHIVIYQLKKRCGDLSEEELGKLSVQLLNCQSEVEQRPIFTCSADMTLAECTKNMDAVTWNTYQIVGNRARAMCYSTQQLQFRRLTEKSVNQLAAATSAQIKSMEELKTGQEQLHSMATDTIRQLFESQQELLVTHEALRAGQNDVFTSVADNVKQLQQEKALIAAGNQELVLLVQKIQAELNTTAQLIKAQEATQHEKHEDILRDLKLIHAQTSEALAKLDASSERLLSHHASLQRQQQEVFTNLQKINATVMDVMATVVGLQAQMERRISWITQLLGGADDKLEVLQCCMLHLAYFLLVVVVAAFLHTPVLTRVLLLVVVVANMAGQLAHHNSLDFAGLTVFMAAIILGHWLLRQIRALSQRRKQGAEGSRGGHFGTITFSGGSSDSTPLSSAEMRQLATLLQRLSHTVPESLGLQPMSNGSIPRSLSTPASPVSSPSRPQYESPPTASPFQPGPSGDTAQNLMNVRQRLLQTVIDDDRMSRCSSRASTPISQISRGSTPSMSSRCLGRTLAGSQCRLSATAGSDFCRRHISDA